MKLFDFVEYVYFVYISCWYETIWFCWLFSVYISAPCQLLVWNYLTVLSFLSVYQPRVSCWFKTIWLCWVFSVYINPVSVVGMKLFDFVDFSPCIYQPRVSCWYETIWLCWVRFLCVYLLFVWNYLILLTFLCVYISPVSVVVSCWFETILFCWVFSVYISPVSVVDDYHTSKLYVSQQKNSMLYL